MNINHTFLHGGGKTSEVILQKDWSNTSLGPIGNWPETLKSAMSLTLHSGFPIAVYWGSDFILLYNDAYSQIPGDKHPWSLGKPGSEAWSEIWEGLEGQFKDVIEKGETVRSPDTLLLMNRYGYTEECYFDYTLSPIVSSSGKIEGVLNAVIETTYKVINERRNSVIYQFLKNLNNSPTVLDSISRIKDILEVAKEDISFYQISTYEDFNKEIVSDELKGIEPNLTWPFYKVDDSEEPFFIKDLSAYLKNEITNAYGEICSEALIVPIHQGDARIKGYFVAGLSPRKRRDKDYDNFIQTIGANICTVLNNAFTLEELQRSKIRVEESEKRFKSMMDQAPVAMAVFRGKDLVVSKVNAIMLEFVGKEADIIGMKLLEAMPEMTDHPLVNAIKKVYQTGTPYYAYDSPVILNIKGKEVLDYYDISYTPFYEDKVIEGVIQVTTKVTEQVLTKKSIGKKNYRLEKALEELRFLANAVPSIVWTSTPEGKIDYINERWTDITGRTVESSLVDNWADSVHPDDINRAFTVWQHSLKTGSNYEIEFRIANKTGAYRWYIIRALPLKNEDGNIIKWYGTNTDIEDQKILERQKDNFLGVASHELKTPITSIKAYAQVMEMMFKKSGDEKNAMLVAKMDKQVNRLNYLIGDLLDVTKINTGRLQFNDTTFDFNQMVEEMVEEVQRTSSKHMITKKLNFKQNVTGDKDRISQVVTNLLTNAIKYSPTANEIIIYTEEHQNEVKLCVQDFGIGISRDKKDKVFEQFYRVSGSKEYTFPGLGLGLYISSEIVKFLGGRIWVNSVKGKGSTFCFSLPLSES